MKKSPKTSPKPLQNPSQNHPENISKIDTKCRRFSAPKEHQNEAKILLKSLPGGTVGPHGIQRDPKEGSRPPRAPKREVPGFFWLQFSSLLEPLLHVFPYHSRPFFDATELCSHPYPTTRNEQHRQRTDVFETNMQYITQNMLQESLESTQH